MIGGGKFENGALTGAFQYLFNALATSRAAAQSVARLRAGSEQARTMLDALQADKNATYYIDVGSAENNGGAFTVTITRTTGSFWDRLLGNARIDTLVKVTFDSSSSVQFTDIRGIQFKPSAERLLAHELGHAYTRLVGGYYDDAIKYENLVGRQLDPNAFIRAVSDHGRGGP